MTQRFPLFFACLVLTTTVLGCRDDAQRRGQIMVAVSTDMSIDKDLDLVDIIVERERDGKLFNDSFELYPTDRGYLVPGTYAIVAGGDGGDAVRVRVLARSSGTVRVAREVTTTIPRNRIGLLPMPVQWLCESELDTDADGDDASTCAIDDPTKTCNLGRCRDAVVASVSLEDYDPRDIYGGYLNGPEAERNGACFDAIGCLTEGTRVEVDLSDPQVCGFERSAGIKTLNVGLVVEGDGHCNPVTGTCYIPLSRSEEYGWTEAGRTVTLPAGVCDRLRDGRALAVVESGACETKDFAIPTCGRWLGGDGIDADGDGIFDEDDNCPFARNEDQSDADVDGVGDECDTAEADRDSDGTVDTVDNCPDDANATQTDTDDDNAGDACDDDDDDDGFADGVDPEPLNRFVPDADGDGIVTEDDNCPTVANPDQLDAEQDGAGDVCDDDDDDDLVSDKTDNCPLVSNEDQSDCDGDATGDLCDACDSVLTLASPADGATLDTRVFGVVGDVGALDLDVVTIRTRSEVSGRELLQTAPVNTVGQFNRQGLILSSGLNTVTAESCNCVSDPVQVTANVPRATILATLTWTLPDADLDLYVYEPSPGEVCYFDATCRLGSGTPLGGVLDVDKTDVEGYGPENYTLSQPEGDTVVAGDYHLRLHYFDGPGAADYQLRVLLNENDPVTEEQHDFGGTLTDRDRTNAAPTGTGTDWLDVATVTCSGADAAVICTLGAGGWAGAPGTGGATAGGDGGGGAAGTSTGGAGTGGASSGGASSGGLASGGVSSGGVSSGGVSSGGVSSGGVSSGGASGGAGGIRTDGGTAGAGDSRTGGTAGIGTCATCAEWYDLSTPYADTCPGGSRDLADALVACACQGQACVEFCSPTCFQAEPAGPLTVTSCVSCLAAYCPTEDRLCTSDTR